MVRHKTFISYHHDNEQLAKDHIIEEFGEEDFIDVSVHDGDIDVNLSEDAIMKKIRDEYLKDSTVTLVIIGEETSQRPFINSEIQASLWGNNPNGLLAIVTDEIYKEIYYEGNCGGVNCDCKVRVPQKHETYLPELVYKNREIGRNNELESTPCHYTDNQIYCSLTRFSDFIKDPDSYINAAFDKRSGLDYNIAKKLSVETPKIQKNSLSLLRL